MGGTTPIPIDARFLAATNRKLEEEVRAGRFREDLYFRINVVPLEMPPLRERHEDVRLLAEATLGRLREQSQRGPLRLTRPALAVLERYAWPGNVRELENVLERTVTLADHDVITPEDLPPALLQADRTGALQEDVRTGRLGFEEAVGRFEQQLLRESLDRHDWNQTRAAEALGITRRLLKLKMDKWGMEP